MCISVSVAQLVEHSIEDPGVGSSILSGDTIAAIAQRKLHSLGMGKVVSSILTSSTSEFVC